MLIKLTAYHANTQPNEAAFLQQLKSGENGSAHILKI